MKVAIVPLDRVEKSRNELPMRSRNSESHSEKEERISALHVAAPILVVEDDPDAVAVIRKLILRAIAAPIDVARNAAEAIEYLEQRLARRDRPLPRLVLVDSNLSGSDGW